MESRYIPCSSREEPEGCDLTGAEEVKTGFIREEKEKTRRDMLRSVGSRISETAEPEKVSI